MRKLALPSLRTARNLAWGALLATLLLAEPNELQLHPEALGVPETAAGQLRLAIRDGSWTIAEYILFEAAVKDPGNKLIHRALGISHYQSGRHYPAAAALKRSDAIAPLDAGARFLLAETYVRLERSHWARAELERLIEENASNARYRLALARIHYRQQRFGAAVDQLREAIRQNPRSADAHDLKGQCLEGLGRPKDAQEAYLTAAGLNDAQERRSAWPHYHLGSLLHDQGDFERAETALALAVESDPSHVAARLELGIVLGKLNRLERAVETLEAAARLAPADAKIQYSLAGIYRRRGHFGRAAAAIERFRELSNDAR